eukprot:GHRQ01021380.1.p3 GENE.GHRQ01021380.1~~GHRQ01021380.1.p3  ORF type:complete len:103 (+),score=25.96 GHRQ01021380.1:677-985(+)
MAGMAQQELQKPPVWTASTQHATAAVVAAATQRRRRQQQRLQCWQPATVCCYQRQKGLPPSMEHEVQTGRQRCAAPGRESSVSRSRTGQHGSTSAIGGYLVP